MSYKSKISNSIDYSYNKSYHLYSYKYGWINSIIHFFLKAFIKSTKIPFVSVSLFFIVIILNIIQKSNNNQYLQTEIKDYVTKTQSSSAFTNTMLFIYNLVGINGFIRNGSGHIMFYILTYICLSLIETNIGHTSVLLFLIILLMSSTFQPEYKEAICNNSLTGSGGLINSPYCCGSIILFGSLGFVLFIIQKYLTNLYYKITIWFIMLCVWVGCIIYDNLDVYSYMPDGERKRCSIFMHHATYFLLGIFCSLALAK